MHSQHISASKAREAMAMSDSELITIRQAASLLGLKYRSLFNLIRDRRPGIVECCRDVTPIWTTKRRVMLVRECVERLARDAQTVRLLGEKGE